MRMYLLLLILLISAVTATALFRYQAEPTADRFVQLAIERGDPTMCDRLEAKHVEPPGPPELDAKGAPSITYPRNSCLMQYLRASKDREACERLSPQDDDASGGAIEACYRFIADVYQDPTVCALIPETPHSWKSVPICLALAKRDVKECDALDEMDKVLSYSAKTDCILEVVKRTRDATSCAGIVRPGYDSFDPTAAAGYRNACLKISWCDTPEKRAEYCAQVQYPVWTLPEEKAECLTETWTCPKLP